jgi:hypothetical protein
VAGVFVFSVLIRAIDPEAERLVHVEFHAGGRHGRMNLRIQ